MKIRPVEAELFHEDGRTDRQTDLTKLIVAFRNFVNSLKHCGAGNLTSNWTAQSTHCAELPRLP
jgi:hypothetical protein